MNSIERTFDIPRFQKRSYPLENAFNYKRDGEWCAVSIEEFLTQADTVSKTFIALGLKKGDNISIISENCMEWSVVDIAASQLGIVVVPIYPNMSPKDAHYILEHSSSKLCFAQSVVDWKKIDAVANQIKACHYTVIFPQNGDALEAGNPSAQKSGDTILFWSDFLKLGRSVSESLIRDFSDRVSSEDLATILYTSGTTGKPKGVMLPHRNIVSNVLDGHESLPVVKKGMRALSFLPISHALERAAIFLYIYRGVSVYYAESLDKISANAREVSPNTMVVVPRLLEKIYETIMIRGGGLKGFKKLIFNFAIREGLRYRPFEALSIWGRLKLSIARKLVLDKWGEAFGGALDFMLCAGAKLNDELLSIFYAARIPIVQGYGMTETSPVITLNGMSKETFCYGAVGHPIKGVEVKLAADGEFLVRGPNVMKGYYKDPEITQETIDEEGFLHTGDVGVINDRGYLLLTDRKKDIFKNSGGKYIAPLPVETALKKSPFIDQAVVVGEGEKFTTAVIQPNFEVLKSWCKDQGWGGLSNAEMVKDARIIKKIESLVPPLMKDFGRWEQVKKLIVVPDVWSVETLEITPTTKVRRKVVIKKYAQEIEQVYWDPNRLSGKRNF